MLFSGEKRRIRELRDSIAEFKREVLSLDELNRFKAIIDRLPPSGFTSEFYDLCMEGDVGSPVRVEIDGKDITICNRKFLAFLRNDYEMVPDPTTSECDRCGRDFGGQCIGQRHEHNSHGRLCGGTIARVKCHERHDTIPAPADQFVTK
jgi:hypothetical protein